MMDYPDTQTHTEFRAALDIDLPDAWNIGLVVGPSGSGKSTLVTQMFGSPNVVVWDKAAVFDNFSLPPSGTIELLCSVGLCSVPTWLRSRTDLSTGEGFRADVARALEASSDARVCVLDEFTSVVDRQVATAVSVCVARYARAAKRRIVCATCHYDVLDWLQPDWVIDTRTSEFQRRVLRRRPEIGLEICEVSAQTAWREFAPYHYMSAQQPGGVQAWCAYLQGRSVAYVSYAHLPHSRVVNIMLCSRLVVLPDYQGLGIARALNNYVAALLFSCGRRVRLRTAHPAAQAMLSHDAAWRYITVGHTATSGRTSRIPRKYAQRELSKRVTRAYEYVG